MKRCCVRDVKPDEMAKLQKDLTNHVNKHLKNGKYKLSQSKARSIENLNLSDLRIVNGSVEIPVVVYVNCPYTNKTTMTADIDAFIANLNDNYSGNVQIPSANINPTYKVAYDNYVALKTPVKVVFVKKRIEFRNALSIRSSDIATIDRQVKFTPATRTSPAKPVVPVSEYGKTLNVWLVTFTNGLLGYAQFPWDLRTKPQTDGVVIDYRTINPKFNYAPYNLNRTAVHEVGHWLGLYHTFQSSPLSGAGALDTNSDGVVSTEEKSGDCVTDTPRQISPTFGNPLNGTSPLPVYNGVLSMFINYMDYVDDASMFMFSAEQAIKIRLMLDLYRSALVNL